MSKEIALQYDLFTGDLVDARNVKQKRRDHEREQLRQTEMFSQKALAQFGVKAKPQLPLSPKTHLELAVQDPRTEEEKGYDQMKAAEAMTYSYLDERPTPEPTRTKLFASGLRLPLVETTDPQPDCAVALTETVGVLYWSNRDEEYERARSETHLAGNEVYRVGDNQLEIWKPDQTGFFLVTYSDMEMVENVEWISS
jgi:hypothetical protein